MITMDIKAPITNKAESTDLITITLSGDTYPVKDRIKERGFIWGGGEWYLTVDRTWFKANGYQFARGVALEFGVKSRDLNIIGDQAKIAMQTIDK